MRVRERERGGGGRERERERGRESMRVRIWRGHIASADRGQPLTHGSPTEADIVDAAAAGLPLLGHEFFTWGGGGFEFSPLFSLFSLSLDELLSPVTLGYPGVQKCMKMPCF